MAKGGKSKPHGTPRPERAGRTKSKLDTAEEKLSESESVETESV